MSCIAPVVHHSSLKEAIELKTIAKTLGYGTLKGLTPYMLQTFRKGSGIFPVLSDTSSIQTSLLTCCALGTLEQLAVECTKKQTDKLRGIGKTLPQLIHLISELGCKILIWGMAMRLGFASIPMTLTGGTLTGTVAIIRVIDSVVNVGTEPLQDLMTWMLRGTASMCHIIGLSFLVHNHPHLFLPLAEGFLLYSWIVFLLSGLDQTISRISQHHLRKPD
jgi:uncharacterized membrane protein